RTLAANVGLLGLAPYGMGRLLGRSDRWLVGFIGALVIVGAVIGWASVYEARMGSNPFDFWRGRWPGDVPWDGALYRAGIRRCAGPFAHPICAGFFFSMLIPLWAWLADIELPSSKSKRALLGMGLLIGILTAVSRGPMLGAAVGAVVMRIGWSSWRVPIGAVMLLGGLMGAGLVADNVGKYLNVSRGDAQTESQETAAYRAEMLKNYLEVVREEPWQGFGRYQVPVIKGQKSIDNQYLFLTLQFGLPRAVLFLLAILSPAGALMYRLMRAPVDHPKGRLGWALLGVLVGSVGTLTTVFAGTQTAQLLLILQGVAVTTAHDLATRTVRAAA
ncbi:MAG: O-antigen ligase family protein, partial [Planctomycetota bacterium]